MNLVEEENKKRTCLLAVYDGIVLEVRNLCATKPEKLPSLATRACTHSDFILLDNFFLCFSSLIVNEIVVAEISAWE